MILFSEHTWGASASGTDPHSKFTKDLWEGKKLMLIMQVISLQILYKQALSPLHVDKGGILYMC